MADGAFVDPKSTARGKHKKKRSLKLSRTSSAAHERSSRTSGVAPKSKGAATVVPIPKAPKTPAAKPAAARTTPTGKRLEAVRDDGGDRFVQTFDCSDTGNAERLAANFGHHVHFVPSWEQYLVYTGKYWKRDTADVSIGRLAKETIAKMLGEAKHLDAFEKKALEKWKKKSASKGARRAMVDLLKHEEGIALDHEEFDKNPWLLNVANGTLDLRTGVPKPHDPKDLITKYIPIAYNSKAKAPRWRKFLEEVLPNEAVRAFVQRFFGYCLTGLVGERVFVVFMGGGCNGKTAFVNAIEHVLGQYTTTVAPTLLIAKPNESHPTETASLFGVRLGVVSETKKGSTFDEERVKRYTGGDRLAARRMHEDWWYFEPTHKLALLCNHRPRVRDATDSFWDRVAMVPFEVRIPKHRIDKELKSKLREEAEGILLWMVEGCAMWREKGLDPPREVADATLAYRNDEDVVGRFLNECCVAEKEAFTLTSEIMKVNKVWAENLNLHQVSAKDLAERLQREPWNCAATKRMGNMGWKGVKVTKKVSFR